MHGCALITVVPGVKMTYMWHSVVGAVCDMLHMTLSLSCHIFSLKYSVHY